MTESSDLASTVTADRAPAELDPKSGLALDLAHRAATFLCPGDLVLEIGPTRVDQPSAIAHLCRARVIVFESDPGRAAMLDAHIAGGALGHHVEIRGVALGAQTQLHAARGSGGPIVALDDVPLPLPPKLITIGPMEHALEILRGAERVVRAHRPCIHVETRTTIELGRALVLLGEWGYEPRGQFGPRPNLFCTPSSAAAKYETGRSECADATSRAPRISQSDRLRQTASDPSREQSEVDPTLTDLARNLDQLRALLEQQLMYTRRIEAGLATSKRRSAAKTHNEVARAPNGATQKSSRSGVPSAASAGLRVHRKLRKLLTRPRSFFRDAKNPLAVLLGAMVFNQPPRR